MSRPLLQIIIGSTRPGRVGLPVAQWFAQRAAQHNDFDIKVIDLAEVGLPLYDEPNHPRLRQYVHQHTLDWSDTIGRADAYVFVVPEYNYGYNAAVKNAIDYLHAEWQYKPVGFVSYGGVAAGTRAVQMLKQVVTTLKMMPVFESVNIPFVQQFLDDEARLQANEVMEAAATAMLDELAKWTHALASFKDGADPRRQRHLERAG
jgi:NAD(P)H-dependent FMN reductase